MEFPYWQQIFPHGRAEIIELSISTLAVAIALAFPDFTSLLSAIAAAIIVFAFHELGHRVVARMMGFRAWYRSFIGGIAAMLITSFITMGNIFFAAPGAVEIEGANARGMAISALAGPLANLLLAIMIWVIEAPLGIRLGGKTSGIFSDIVMASAYMGLFNLTPRRPFDGWFVRNYSFLLWVTAFTAAIALNAAYIVSIILG